jgi:hypothetical protein
VASVCVDELGLWLNEVGLRLLDISQIINFFLLFLGLEHLGLLDLAFFIELVFDKGPKDTGILPKDMNRPRHIFPFEGCRMEFANLALAIELKVVFAIRYFLSHRWELVGLCIKFLLG